MIKNTSLNDTIAIKIPLFNAESTILDTLDSLLNQTHQNFFIYIYDNASTDNSIKNIMSLNDNRIEIIRAEQNKGFSGNVDRCLGVCEEKYLLIAHADDIYHPQFLEKNLEVLKKNGPRLLFTEGVQFNRIEEIRYKPISSDVLNLDIYENHEVLLDAIVKNGNFIFCPTAFGYSLDMINYISFFDGDQFGGSADLDAWLRYVRVQPIGILKIKELFFYRISKTHLSYTDLVREKPVFLKCCNFHVETALIGEAKRSDLRLSLKWHNLYFDVMRYLTSLNSKNIPRIFELNNIINSRVSLSKKTKLIFLIVLSKITSFFPIKVQEILCFELLKRVRKS